MLQKIVEWLSNHLLPCAYNQLFGIKCPICGFQRAIILLLEGKFLDSIYMYPPLFLMIGTFIWIFYLLIRKKSLKTKAMKIVLIINAIILIVNCLYKNIVF
jgi:hypothetical protein